MCESWESVVVQAVLHHVICTQWDVIGVMSLLLAALLFDAVPPAILSCPLGTAAPASRASE